MRTLLAALTLGVLPMGVAAQSAADICSAFQQPQIGHWSGYTVTSPQLKGPAAMRFAIVGSEEVDGAAHVWYELKMDATEGSMVMQFLVPAYPFDPSDVKTIVMKGGGQPAMKMPEQMMSMMRSKLPRDFAGEAARSCGDAEVVGWEDIEVEAGSFNALHIRTKDGDAWASTDVPFGLVKFTGASGNLVLTGHGADATSSITEKPMEMPGMGR